MLSKQQKIDLVGELAEKIKEAQSVLLVDFSGLKVGENSKLRQALRQEGIEIKAAKKTLIQRAMASAGVEGFDLSVCPSSSALVFSSEEGPLASKQIYDFSKKNNKLKIFGGFVSGQFVGVDKIVSLAKLPSREVLVSQLLGILNNLPGALVGVLGGLNRKLVSVIDQISRVKA